MPPSSKVVQGLSVAEDEHYVSVKNRLMEAAGLTSREAGIQLFQLDRTSLVGKTALEVFQLVTRLISRIFKGAVNMQDCAFALAMLVFRKLLPKEPREWPSWIRSAQSQWRS